MSSKKSSPTRLHVWSSLTLCSAVILASLVDVGIEGGSFLKWDICVSSISLIISISFSAAYATSKLLKLRDSIAEFACIVITFCSWAAFVSTYYNRKGTGVVVGFRTNGTKVAVIRNGNQYFFSWFALIASFLLFSSYIQTKFKVYEGDEVKSFTTRFSMWFFLFFTAMVVMSAASNILHTTTCSELSAQYCTNTVIAIGVGAYSVLFSILAVCVILTKRLDEKKSIVIQTGFSLSVSAGFIASLHYITSPRGPGEAIGTLYYSTWASFILSTAICYYSLDDMGVFVAISKRFSRYPQKGKRSKKSKGNSKKKKGKAKSADKAAASAEDNEKASTSAPKTKLPVDPSIYLTAENMNTGKSVALDVIGLEEDIYGNAESDGSFEPNEPRSEQGRSLGLNTGETLLESDGRADRRTSV